MSHLWFPLYLYFVLVVHTSTLCLLSHLYPYLVLVAPPPLPRACPISTSCLLSQSHLYLLVPQSSSYRSNSIFQAHTIVAMSTNGIIHSRKNYKVCTKLDENASYSLTELRPVQLPEDPDLLESQKYKGEEEDHDSGYDEGRASESDEEKELESDEFGQGNLVIEESDSSPVPSPKRQDGKSKCLLEENKSTSTADESGKIQRRSDLRNESLKKMRDGKAWLIKTLIFVESAVCSLSLCEVVDEYRSYCRSTNRTPVTTPVLARLIRSVFSSATKCRVGPRGSQKIHYRNLQWRQDACNCSISKPLEKPEETVSSNEFQKVELFVSSCNQDQEKTQLEDHQDSQVIHNESLYKKCIEVNVKQESVDSLKDDDDKQVQENRKDLDPYSDEKESKSSEEREEEQEGKLLVEEAPDRRNPGEEAQIKDNQGECETAANGLSRVIKWMYEQNKMMTLLQYFAHSASCRNQTCSPICLMFRRVRRHVVGARHACSVLQVYSTLLRTHVSTCKSADCGLPACPVLRYTQEKKRSHRQSLAANKRQRTLPIIQTTLPQTVDNTTASPTTPPVNGPPQIVYVPVMMQLADPRGA